MSQPFWEWQGPPGLWAVVPAVALVGMAAALVESRAHVMEAMAVSEEVLAVPGVEPGAVSEAGPMVLFPAVENMATF